MAFLVLGDRRLAGDPIYATSPLSCFMVLCSSSYFAYDLLQVGVGWGGVGDIGVQ